MPVRVALAVAALLVSGCSSAPTVVTSPLPSQPSRSPSVAGPTLPPAGTQPGQIRLRGHSWTITYIDGAAPTVATWISFWPGSPARGAVKSDCSFIFFDYAYDPIGSAFTMRLGADGDGSYTDGCGEGASDLYGHMFAALPDVAEWRLDPDDRLELLGRDGAVVISGPPVPRLPTPSAAGDCGSVSFAVCQEAVTQAFNFGLYPLSSGQRVVGWSVRDSVHGECAPGIDARYQVTFEVANPRAEWRVIVGASDGRLTACPLY